MNKQFKGFILGVGLTLIFIVVMGSSRLDFDRGESLKIFLNAFRELNLVYVDQPDPEVMAKDAIDGMLKGLDPYTTYMNKEESEAFDEATSGEYAGMGAIISKSLSNKYAEIEEVIENSPAHKAGLTIGDRLLSIDKKTIEHLDNKEVSSSLRGKAGTSFNLEYISLLTGETVNVKIKRDIIHTTSVPYYGIIKNSDGVGYIMLSTFSSSSYTETREAVESLLATGEVKSLILDLRDNGGGILGEAVKIVSLFVDKGTEVVKVDGRSYKTPSIMKTQSEPIAGNLPLVVMVNGNSASASEVVAGAIQDLDRGLIVGSQTFGKGLVQNTRDLGSGTTLKVTTAKYYTPSGRCIQLVDYAHRDSDGGAGVIPDSLKKEFKTVSGRVVYDGGGIMPDSVIVEQNYTRFVENAVSRANYMSDFVKQYYKNNRGDITPGEFEVDDKILNQFAAHLVENDFEVLTLTNYYLDLLKKAAEEEYYTSKIENEISTIEKSLKVDITEDIELNREQIKKFLELEIITAYKLQAGKMEHFAQTDSDVAKAVECLEKGFDLK